MKVIESRVAPPAGASPLGSYARAYAYGANNKVIGSYFIPSRPDEQFCKLASQSAGGQTALFCAPPKGMVAGERRWFEDFRYLPQADDGGCDWIDLSFDLDSKRVESVQCHGQA